VKEIKPTINVCEKCAHALKDPPNRLPWHNQYFYCHLDLKPNHYSHLKGDWENKPLYIGQVGLLGRYDYRKGMTSIPDKCPYQLEHIMQRRNRE
jgi:hypothetical protein